MDSVTQHYIIDLSSNNNYVQVPAVEGDGHSVRYMEIELIQNGVPYVVDPSTTSITIMGTNAAGSEIWNFGEVTSEGYVKFELTYPMMSAPGRGVYQVALMSTETNTQLKSFPFYVIVAKAALDASEITESNEFQVLSDLMGEVENLYEEAEGIVERAQEAAQDAEESEIAAEEHATNAATSASNAAASALNAATSESNASASASNASISEQTARTKASEAATSASNAAASETAAASSEKNAATSETNAAASAAAAASSETNAAESEQSANEAMTTAVASASAASASEQNAAESEANAAESETNAATSEQNAAVSETNAETYAIAAESYAQGGTNTRPGEDMANAKYYKEQCEALYENIGGSLVPMGTIYFADLASVTPQAGYSYNIIDAFTTTSDFKGGAGISVPAGSTVYRTGDGYWDILPGGLVTGVKGEAESSFRTGNVEITKANLGIADAINVVISSTEPSQSENDYWIQDYN